MPFEATAKMIPAPEKEKRRNPYAAVVALSIIALMAEIGYQSTTVMAMPFLLHARLHLTMRVVGIMTMAFLVAEAATKIPFGTMSDRYGRRWFLTIGPLFSALAALSVTLVPPAELIFVIRALDGVGAAMLWPTLFATVADVVDDRHRATAMSVFNVMYFGGLMAGPALYSFVTATAAGAGSGVPNSTGHAALFLQAHAPHLALFLQRHADVAIFYVLSGLFLACSITALIAAPRKRANGQAHLEVSDHAAAPSASAWQVVRRSPVLLAMAVIAVVMFLGLHLLNGVLTIYLNEELGIRKEVIGHLFLYIGVVVAVLALPMGRLVDRMGKPEAVRLGFAVCAAGLWLLPWVHSMPLLVLTAGLFGLGLLLASPAWLALMTELAGEQCRGGVVGIMNTAQGVGAALGAAFGGTLYDLLGHRSPFIASALLFSVSVLIVFRYVHADNLPPHPAKC